MRLKKVDLEREGYKKIFPGDEVWSVMRHWKYLKRGAWQERNRGKVKEGGCDPQKKYGITTR